MRSTLERTRSKHDHNKVPGTQSALNVRAHKERLPWASFRDKQVLTMGGWDASPMDTLAGYRAAKARAADYR